MKKETFFLCLTTLITATFITMLISSWVTFISLSDPSLFWSVWPKNWFYAVVIAFPAILLIKPIALKIGTIITNYFY
jgi:hypothetical protein